MRHIAKHVDNRDFVVPSDVTYLPEYRLMMQTALQRNTSKILEEEQAARVLASYHALSIEDVPTRRRCATEEISNTRQLVEQIFPECMALFDKVCDRLLRVEYGIQEDPKVLLHGDAHLGNLFPLYEKQVGIIDLDAVHKGPAVDDLTTFFAFKLWLSARQEQDFSTLIDRFSNFTAIYNSHADYSVDTSMAYLNLALRMVTERIHRGITRGKLAGEKELFTYLEIADQCVKQADKFDA
jgi:aminoglycoside phosphotransferase (APT) family kinase protein